MEMDKLIHLSRYQKLILIAKRGHDAWVAQNMCLPRACNTVASSIIKLSGLFFALKEHSFYYLDSQNLTTLNLDNFPKSEKENFVVVKKLWLGGLPFHGNTFPAARIIYH